jgi:hypothetical protein
VSNPGQRRAFASSIQPGIEDKRTGMYILIKIDAQAYLRQRVKASARLEREKERQQGKNGRTRRGSRQKRKR